MKEYELHRRTSVSGREKEKERERERESEMQENAWREYAKSWSRAGESSNRGEHDMPRENVTTNETFVPKPNARVYRGVNFERNCDSRHFYACFALSGELFGNFTNILEFICYREKFV